MAAADRVFVNLEAVGAVLELIADAYAVRWQLLRFTHRNETRIQRVGQGRREDKSARFDTDNHVDAGVLVMLLEPVDGVMKAPVVLEQRGDVIEQDSRLGEIRESCSMTSPRCSRTTGAF